MKNFARIENGKVVERLDADELPPFHPSLHWEQCTAEVCEGWVFNGKDFAQPIPPTHAPAEIIATYTAAIQKRLDTFAQTRNYDGILSATTYATSQVPKFKAEGQYAVEARDATWAKCYEILAAVETGSRPMPTLDELLAELPVLTWPN